MSLTPTDLTKIKKVLLVVFDPKFKAIEKRFEIVDKKFDNIDRKFEDIEGQFENIDRRFGKVDKRFDTIEEKMGGFLTKHDFLNKMDEVMGELQESRQEQTFIVHRSSDLEDRVSALEKSPPHSKRV